MLLEKSESLLELFVKQLVIQSRLACLVCEKPDFDVVCSKVKYFRIRQEDLSKSKSNLILFKS